MFPMNIKKYISEWTIKFLKNKDILQKNIVSIENSSEGSDRFKVNYKDKVMTCISSESIGNFPFLPSFGKDEFIWITTINSKENFESLVKNWEIISNYKNSAICFINPFSALDAKWIVKPYTHNLISDNSSLKLGLKAMYDAVEETTIEDFKLRASLS